MTFNLNAYRYYRLHGILYQLEFLVSAQHSHVMSDPGKLHQLNLVTLFHLTIDKHFIVKTNFQFSMLIRTRIKYIQEWTTKFYQSLILNISFDLDFMSFFHYFLWINKYLPLQLTVRYEYLIVMNMVPVLYYINKKQLITLYTFADMFHRRRN